MAKKSRTPEPPRRPVQAPQRRDTKKSRGGGLDPNLKRKLLRYGTPAVAALAVVIVLVVVFASGGSSESLATAFADAGCKLTSYPGQPATHTSNLNEKVKYNSFPPSNGRHYQSPVPWNSYPQPVNSVQALHNLEHGGIWILWRPSAPRAQRDALQDWYDSDSNALLVSPFEPADLRAHPNFDANFALVAWNAPSGEAGNGRVLTCPSFDEEAFAKFKDVYRGKGPERFDVSTLTRGAA
jgi:hypothetical protein